MARRGGLGRYDEDDVRIRPTRNGSRPRSKQRPDHVEALDGRVTTVDRGRFAVLLDDGTELIAMRARELGRAGIVVGDRVGVVGDTSGDDDALARIVRRDERTTILRRSADDDNPTERVLVANADQLVVVTALADPPPSFGFIDRCVVAALTAGLQPLLCLTKADLAEPDETIARYQVLDVSAVVLQRDRFDVDLDRLRQRLVGQSSVLIGHSGVGKSTLVNALVPTALRSTGVVSAIGKGRHTSSSAIALLLPDDPEGGWVVDTPGVRSFGLAHVGPDDLLWAFPDLEGGAILCPRGCKHLTAADGCTLDEWVRTGHAVLERLEAFRRLAESLAKGGDQRVSEH